MTTGYYFHNNFIYTAVLYVNQFIEGLSLMVGKYIHIGCMAHTYCTMNERPSTVEMTKQQLLSVRIRT